MASSGHGVAGQASSGPASSKLATTPFNGVSSSVQVPSRAASIENQDLRLRDAPQQSVMENATQGDRGGGSRVNKAGPPLPPGTSPSLATKGPPPVVKATNVVPIGMLLRQKCLVNTSSTKPQKLRSCSFCGPHKKVMACQGSALSQETPYHHKGVSGQSAGNTGSTTFTAIPNSLRKFQSKGGVLGRLAVAQHKTN